MTGLQEQLRPTGFIAEGHWSEGRRTGFSLYSLEDGRRFPLARNVPIPGGQQTGRFHFHPEAFRTGEMLVLKGLDRGARLLLVDEVGPLELKGQGWSSLLDQVIDKYSVCQLWVVRASILEEVVERWAIDRNEVFRMKEENAPHLTKHIVDYVRSYESRPDH
jgi:nucleoside-triphosphatase THEP1